VAQCKHT